ncbi:hypothetical protein SAMN05421548_102278 [Paraburkholderia lycopersici]|uniref:Uncharacterized protein n=1 Tax=Paraburkholderia lycopersici TaxID=416944 RepID=A0A1G6HI94_9BURK|nr:hypothetical protein SAMN05421548_102278 [Paraburkholderia lycopersici]
MDTYVNRRAGAFCAAALLFTSAAQATPIAYPAKGQSAQQQRSDESACYAWAKNNTGVDPAQVASTPPPPSGPAVGGGERVQGAARGAAGGGCDRRHHWRCRQGRGDRRGRRNDGGRGAGAAEPACAAGQ